MKDSPSPFSPVKPKRQNIPKIRPLICNQLLKYSISSHFLRKESDNIQLLYSLINQKFNQQARKFNNGNTSIDVDFIVNFDEQRNYDNSISVKGSSYFSIISNNRFENILSLLKLTEFTVLNFRILYDVLNFDEQNVRRDLFNGFANFCRKLREIEPLKKIFVSLIQYNMFSMLMPAFFELLFLSKKSMSIESPYFNVSPLLKKNNIVLDSWKIWAFSFEECTSQLFKTHVKHLILTDKNAHSSDHLKLHHLKKFGPFSQNLHLEHLNINVDLMCFNFDTDKENKPLSDLLESFQFLKELNPNLTLTLKSNESINVETPNEGFIFYKKQINQTKKFIDMAHEFGFKIEKFYTKTEFRLADVTKIFTFIENFKQIIKPERSAELEYKGTKILSKFLSGMAM